MPAATIGGVRFAMDRALVSVDDSGFSDLDLTATWFTGDPPSGTRLSPPRWISPCGSTGPPVPCTSR